MVLSVIKIRLNTNGSIDASFVTGAGFDNVTALAIQPDGKNYRRCFTMYKGIAANKIVRLNLDGSFSIFYSGLVLDNGVND
jgi:hypothetical protein